MSTGHSVSPPPKQGIGYWRVIMPLILFLGLTFLWTLGLWQVYDIWNWTMPWYYYPVCLFSPLASGLIWALVNTMKESVRSSDDASLSSSSFQLGWGTIFMLGFVLPLTIAIWGGFKYQRAAKGAASSRPQAVAKLPENWQEDYLVMLVPAILQEGGVQGMANKWELKATRSSHSEIVEFNPMENPGPIVSEFSVADRIGGSFSVRQTGYWLKNVELRCSVDGGTWRPATKFSHYIGGEENDSVVIRWKKTKKTVVPVDRVLRVVLVHTRGPEQLQFILREVPPGALVYVGRIFTEWQSTKELGDEFKYVETGWTSPGWAAPGWRIESKVSLTFSQSNGQILPDEKTVYAKIKFGDGPGQPHVGRVWRSTTGRQQNPVLSFRNVSSERLTIHLTVTPQDAYRVVP